MHSPAVKNTIKHQHPVPRHSLALAYFCHLVSGVLHHTPAPTVPVLFFFFSEVFLQEICHLQSQLKGPCQRGLLQLPKLWQQLITYTCSILHHFISILVISITAIILLVSSSVHCHGPQKSRNHFCLMHCDILRT